MRTFSFLKGVKAVNDQGQLLGKVEDVVLNAKGTVLGWVICKKRLLPHRTYVPCQGAHVSLDHSLVCCKGEVTKVPHLPSGCFYIGKGPRNLWKQALCSSDGCTEAVIEDVYFSSDWSKIIAIEVTKGLFPDWNDGRPLIYSHEPVTIGTQRLFVR
ncbi:hypothetical protein A374_11130 [Fictibacillus macauensis ZFHKF-1]|uniref:PRC-barrel domain-containing protein n=1 Tax=Fictibacillus macauensis ZFHKF-1 TaxID=1196324 RepID=I8AHT8_9BACL|nr:PRC-barrel domain-containing protein [Fictibacillus macauensis]EIT85292.1 hypothetical protein A374_11130 [Fictibacillus macauensis ZFHKF-1]